MSGEWSGGRTRGAASRIAASATMNTVEGTSLSRRRFLALGGGVALLAACGSSKSRQAGGTASTSPTFTEVAPGIVSMDLYVSPRPQRFAFALLAKEGYASGKQARVALAAPGHRPTTFVRAVARAKGLPQFRGVYTVMAKLDRPGIWRGVLEYGGTHTPFVFQVGAKPASVAPGDPAPRAASPTTRDPLGVHPICTRTPACPLHTVSLHSIIGQGRPIAVMFATPARCQTRYCGPVLDTMLPMVESYSDRIDFVHVEIYKNNQTTDVIPTVRAWRLGGEPWLFGIDTRGLVTARLDGAFDQTEMRALLDGLVTAG
jgi:hypothetical protein